MLPFSAVIATTDNACKGMVSSFEVFLDSTNSITLRNILSDPVPFEKQNTLNVGYTNSTTWVRINQPKTLCKHDFYLFTTHPSINYIDFYLVKGDTIKKHLATGNLRPVNSRELETVNFGLKVTEPQQIDFIYIKMHNRISTLKTNFYIYPSEKDFIKNLQKDQIIFFLAMGFILFQFVYAFILGFREKEKIIFWYSSFVIFSFFHQLSNAGYLYLPASSDWLKWIDTFRIETSFFFMFTLLGFSYHLLDVNTLFSKKIAYWHKTLMGSFIFMMVVALYESFLIRFATFFIWFLSLLLIISLLHILITSVLAYRKGHKPALYLIVAQIPILLLIMLYTLINTGWIPDVKNMNYLVTFVIVYECAISIFVLTIYLDRLKSYRFSFSQISAQNQVLNQLNEVPHKNPLSAEIQQNKKIFNEISTHLKEKKSFLQYGLKLSDISAHLGYSIHDISRAINSEGKVHFSDYVNGLRINYAVKLLMSDKFPNLYTIETIALESGFKNRSSFYNAFKRIHDCTPGEYRKRYAETSIIELKHTRG